jgi:hypothetical protein
MAKKSFFKLIKYFFVFFLVFFILVILKYNTLNLNFYWDESLLGISVRGFQLDHTPKLVAVEESYLFHTTLTPYVLGIISSVFGYNPLYFRIFILITATIGIIYMFLLSKKIFKNNFVSFCSCILLVFLPSYFSFLGRIYNEIPLVTLTIALIYYLINRKYLLVSVVGLIGILVKESFILVFPAAIFSVWLNKDIKKLKNLVYLSIPVLVFLLWLCLTLILYKDNFFFFKNIFFPPLDSNHFRIVLFNLKSTLIDNYYFLLTFPSIIYVLVVGYKKSLDSIEKMLISYVLVYLAFLLVSFSLPRYTLVLYPALVIFLIKFLVSISSPDNLNKLTAIVTILLLIAFVSKYETRNNDPCGCNLEDNLNYIRSLDTIVSAARYIDSNYRENTMLTSWPMLAYLTYPYLGYVNKSIKNINFFDSHEPKYDIIVISSQLADYQRLQELIDSLSKEGKVELVANFEQGESFTRIYKKKDY